jgi:hypothetical protein
MEYIIDAYNLIKCSYIGRYEHSRSMEYAKDVLLNLLLDYKRKHPSVIFTVVFDGFPPSAGIFLKDRKIHILFSYESTADEVIRQLLEKKTSHNRTKTVVSNDRGVKDCGHLLGGNVLNVEEFLAVVSPPVRKTGKERNEGGREINRVTIEKELKEHYKTQ